MVVMEQFFNEMAKSPYFKEIMENKDGPLKHVLVYDDIMSREAASGVKELLNKNTTSTIVDNKSFFKVAHKR